MVCYVIVIKNVSGKLNLKGSMNGYKTKIKEEYRILETTLINGKTDFI